MVDRLNELAAKMKKLDVDNEEMEEERLNPELQRELCFAVLCERMDIRNYRWGYCADETDESNQGPPRSLGWNYKPILQKPFFDEIPYIPYVPTLAAEFILSGKEQFQAFMRFCKSVKKLKIESDEAGFYFDKEVCMTEVDPMYKLDEKMFKSKECFFIQALLKNVKCLELPDYHCFNCLESLFPHLSKMQNLEELVIEDEYIHVGQLVDLLKVKQMKTIEAYFSLFEQMDKHITNYKLEKLLIRGYYEPKNVFELSNFSPNELHLTRCSLDAWDVVSENKAFADTKKLFIAIEWPNQSHTDPLCGQLKRLLLSADQFIGSAQEQLPKLKALVFEFKWLTIRHHNLNDPGNQWKLFADLCSDFLKKYQGKLDVNLTFIWREDLYELKFHEYMKKQFPDQEYEVREGNRYSVYTKYFWKNRFTLAKYVVLDYQVIVCVLRH